MPVHMPQIADMDPHSVLLGKRSRVLLLIRKLGALQAFGFAVGLMHVGSSS